MWIDREQIREQLRPEDKFPEAIRRAIKDADVVLVLISPHAVRLPGDEGNPDSGASVCLNELLQAHEDRKPIVPVIVVPCEPPFLINIVRRIDLSRAIASPSAYREGLGEILAAIEVAKERGTSVYIPELERLHPLDFRAEVVRGALDFSGRGWLFDRIAAWTRGPSRCLVIEGDAGSGKSAIVGELVRRDPGGSLLAYHFCRADRTTTVQAPAFVRSLAAMIGGRMEAYGALLNGDDLRLRLVGDASTADPLSALMSCVVTPLAGLPQRGTRTIVVDALDEAVASDGRAVLTIPQMLARALPDFPDWLKLVVTTRRDPRIAALFHDAETIRLDGDDAHQRADVAAYLTAKLADANPDAAAPIQARSGGNFLYARQVAEAVEKGELQLADVDRLPRGLAALFARTFQGRFSDAASFGPTESLLGVVLAAEEPLSATQIAAASGLRLREDVLSTLETLTGYLVAADGSDSANAFTVFHKSLADWLAAPPVGNDVFKVDVMAGRRRLLDWCRNWRATSDPYVLTHLVRHLLSAGEVAEALQSVHDGYFARRSGRIVRADLDDTSTLVLALVAQGDEAAIKELATTGSSWQRDGAAAALQTAPASASPLVDRIVDALLRTKIADPLHPSPKVLAGRRTAIRVAEARDLDERLMQAARDKSPPVRIALATVVYRHWVRRRDSGWRLLDRLAREMFGALALPRPAILEVMGHASLAILNNHREEQAEMGRLLAVWRAVAQRTTSGPLVRALGQNWALNLMLRPMVELMRRQPAYQPLNARETAVTFARDDAFRAQWQVALDCLERPEQGPAPIVAMLSRSDLPFDVYLMIVVERALICQGDRDFATTFDAIETLFQRGAPWFRQSALYVLFHMLGRAASIDDNHLQRYGAMTVDFFAASGATMTTTVRTYSFSPHLAWPEIVAETHRRGRGPWLLPGLLQTALASGEDAKVERVFKAIDLVGFAYGRGTLALALIEKAREIGGAAVEPRLVECLANLRFQDEALVDEFLERRDFARLAPTVRATSPSISGEDIPTWVDGFVVQSMLTSPDFRTQVCGAFRRALTARSTSQFLRQILIWVIAMLAGNAARQPG